MPRRDSQPGPSTELIRENITFEGYCLSNLYNNSKESFILLLFVVLVSISNYYKTKSLENLLSYGPAFIASGVFYLITKTARKDRHRNPLLYLWVDLISYLFAVGTAHSCSILYNLNIISINAPAQMTLLLLGLFTFRANRNMDFFKLVACVCLFILGEKAFGVSKQYIIAQAGQLVAGMFSGIICTIVMHRLRKFGYYLSVANREKATEHVEKIRTEHELKIQVARVYTMLSIADRINSPITAIRNVLPIIEKELSGDETQDTSAKKENAKRGLVAHKVLVKALCSLEKLSNEVNEFRENTGQVDTKMLKLRTTCANIDKNISVEKKQISK